MKKTIIILSTLILFVVVIFFCLYFVYTTPNFTGNFSINEFQDEIENINFQTKKNYGDINDYKSAAKAGKTAISERFENSNGSIFEWRGCDVQYDKENDAYCVYTYYISSFVFGGDYIVIIQSDGTVLAIWGEK